MVSNDDRREMIEMIRALPGEVEEAVRGLGDEQLDTPYREGGWTIRQVVHHLADSHLNAFVRMKLVLTEDHPTLKPYDQDRWAACRDASAIPIGPSLLILQGLHHRWVELMNGVEEAGWVRGAHHPEDGELTLGGLLKIYARHGANHVGQIRQLRTARRW
ncbi:MAG: putative metal-dependent hydrolase [Bacteroidota bacterium]